MRVSLNDKGENRPAEPFTAARRNCVIPQDGQDVCGVVLSKSGLVHEGHESRQVICPRLVGVEVMCRVLKWKGVRYRTAKVSADPTFPRRPRSVLFYDHIL